MRDPYVDKFTGQYSRMAVAKIREHAFYNGLVLGAVAVAIVITAIHAIAGWM